MTRLAVESAELEAICRALRDQADELADQATIVRRCAFDGALAGAAMLAPSETAAAEAQILAAATRASVLVAELQAFALATAAGAELYERADEMLADAAKALATVGQLLVVSNAAYRSWVYKEAFPWFIGTTVDSLVRDYGAAAAGMIALTEFFGVNLIDPDLSHGKLTNNGEFKKVDFTKLKPAEQRAAFLKFLVEAETNAYNKPKSEGGPVLGDGSPQFVMTKVQTADGIRTIVNIPGTIPGWGVTGFGSDAAVMADTKATTLSERSELVQELAAVLEEAGIGKDDHVVLTGHSLGGMTAASLASDQKLVDRFGIKGIVAWGAPINDYPVVPDVDVLAFKSKQDWIHQFESAPDADPDRSNWTTITDNDPEGSVWPLATHNSDTHYRKMMLGHRDDREVIQWLNETGVIGTAEKQRISGIYIQDGPRDAGGR